MEKNSASSPTGSQRLDQENPEGLSSSPERLSISPESLSISPERLSISGAQQIVDQWIQTIGVRYFNELTNLAQLVEEVGEVARIISRTYGEQSWKKEEAPAGDSPADATGPLADELADVLFVTICLANQTGINLEQALRNNLEKKTKRDAERHRGNEKLAGG